MAEKTLGPLPRYNSIGDAEKHNIERALKHPLSGYIGGTPSTGYFVNQLVDEWQAAFDVNYAVPCNSATSGLMAACMAAGIGPGDEVWCSTYTMSATATCAMMLGAKVTFQDIEPEYFCLSSLACHNNIQPKAIIVTNLFGSAAALRILRRYCDAGGITLIEDNAQAPFATCDQKFTGTIGHMGVFSLNVHKHMQCGEGGVVVTNSLMYSDRLEAAINHGELIPSAAGPLYLGGNFRMTELTAAVACAQLKKGTSLVRGRIELAEALTAIFKQVSFVTPPIKRLGEVHAYYLWAGKVANGLRSKLVRGLRDRGVPFREGYSEPLHRLFGCDYSLPIAEAIENQRLITFEVCAYDPKEHHLKRMREIVLEEADRIEKELHHDAGQMHDWEQDGGRVGSSP